MRLRAWLFFCLGAYTLIMKDKEERITYASETIRELETLNAKLRNEALRSRGNEVIRALRDLRDTQYLFDSGETELIRLYERYLPYYLDILRQFVNLQDSANYEAIQSNENQLRNTMERMSELIRRVTRTLPQDEIDAANAAAKAEEERRKLEEQRNNMIK